ncbi:MAG: HtaA domain-containing protein [Corynebacterium sp.]|nr:HtaA domain-containing protein [Corynebacterium sp.]
MRATRTLRTIAATSAAGALVLASGIFAPIISLPTSSAATIGTCSGVADWGLKQSFRKYIRGNVAHGDWELSDGATYQGDTENGYYEFPVKSAGYSKDGDNIVLSFDGTLHFLGHNGLLDMTFSNIRVKANGTQASILADVASKEFDMSTFSVGADINGTDVEIATITLEKPISADDNSFDLTGTSVLADGGVEYFGAYNAGDELDPLSGHVDCTGSGSGLSQSTASDSNAGSLTSNLANIFGEFNKMMTNSIKLIENTEKLNSMISGKDSSAGTKSSAATSDSTSKSGTSNSAGSVTNGTTNSETASAAQNATGNGDQATAPGQQVCTVADVAGVEKSQVNWGVKESFQSYIRGSIAKGGWELTDMDFSNGDFIWSGSGGSVDENAKEGSVQAQGTVEFTGHGGILDLVISDVEVDFSGNSGKLIATVTSNDMDGNSHDFGRVALADLSFSSLNISGGEISGDTSSVTLTAAGVEAFASFYEEGTELAPLSFTASLGEPETACTTGTSGNISSARSASSGTSNSGVAAAARARTTASTGSSTGSGTSAQSKTTTAGTKHSSTTDTDAAPANSFKIKTTAAQADQQNTASSLLSSTMDFRTAVILLIAAFVVAGTSLGQFIFRNPAKRK